MIKVKFQGADLPTADKVLVLLNCSQDANHKSVQLCSPDEDHAGLLAYILTLFLRNLGNSGVIGGVLLPSVLRFTSAVQKMREKTKEEYAWSNLPGNSWRQMCLLPRPAKPPVTVLQYLSPWQQEQLKISRVSQGKKF